MASMFAFVAVSTTLLHCEKVHVVVSMAFQESKGVLSPTLSKVVALVEYVATLPVAPLLVPVVCGQRVCEQCLVLHLRFRRTAEVVLPFLYDPFHICSVAPFVFQFFFLLVLLLFFVFPLLLFFFKFLLFLCRFLIFFSFLRSSCYGLFLCQNLF